MTISYAIIGPPGTGKTTRIASLVAEAVERREGVCVCSLTRTAAAEAASRVVGGKGKAGLHKDRVGTLHSFAYRALGSPKVAEAQAEAWAELHPQLDIRAYSRDTDNPMEMPMGSKGRQGAGYRMYQLARATMLERERWPGAAIQFAEKWETWKEENELVDFTDMISMAADNCAFMPGHPDTILIDEAQDLSRLQLHLARKWAVGTSRLIICGDDRQALYVWAGAHPAMFRDPKLSSREVLEQSYRVPEAVHTAAEKWARRLSDWEHVPWKPRKGGSGKVGRLACRWKRPYPALRRAEECAANGRTVIIAASCSYMVAPIVRMLRMAGIPFSNPWRRTRGDWNPMSGGRGTSMRERIMALLTIDGRVVPGWHPSWTNEEIAAWVAPLEAKNVLRYGAKKQIDLAAAEKPGAVALDGALRQWFNNSYALTDLRDAVADEQAGASEDLLKWWGDMLRKTKRKATSYAMIVAEKHGYQALLQEPKIHVGTIHSFKGAEADEVIIFPDLSLAGMKQWDSGGSSRDEITRLGYVALTRARQHVLICEPSSRLTMPLLEVA